MTDGKVVTAGFVVTPETIAGRSFTTAFRGFDQSEVRAFLQRVSEELASAAEREAQLRRLLHEAENRAAHPEVDEDVITSALGEHAARLLTSAREQATAIRSEAESKASRLMRDAEAQIARIRSEADGLLARRVEEVDGVTANLRNAAEADARALRDQVQADVEAELASARSQGREMVTEARTVRERILTDLARRRHIAEMQLDQLRAARERLLSAYALVRRTLDEATQELKTAEVEARLAADDVARRTPEPPAVATVEGLTPPRGQPSVQVASSSHLSTMAVRPPRSEPAVRSEARIRPPGRPGESRPSPPSRRAPDLHPAPDAEPPSRRPPAPAESAVAMPPATMPPATMPPATMPPAGSPPVQAAPAPPKAPAPEPPGILPRPVPTPPLRPAPSGREPVGGPPPGGPAPAPPGAADRVDALFARIKADRAVTAAAAEAAASPPMPPPMPPPVDVPAEATAPTELRETPPAEPSPGAPERSRAAGPSREIVDEAARVRRDEALEPLETNLARHMKRVLQDEQNEVLDRLRRKRRKRDSALLLPADEQAARFRETAQHLLEEAVRAGATFAGGDGVRGSNAIDTVDPEAGRQVAEELAREIVEPLRERLERSLAEGDDDEQPSERSEALSAVYRQWRTQEIDRLSRHYAVAAFVRGAYGAYPEGANLRWVIDDEAPCPDCDDNELAGSVVKGEPYPTGQAHPPAHPGCRCLLLPNVP